MKLTTIIDKLQNGECSDVFMEMYQDPDLYVPKISRMIDALEGYFRTFKDMEGFTDDVSVFSAPGRTEIGGNHTDHQHGIVLAASINRDILAVAAKNKTNMVNIYSEGYGMISVPIGDYKPDESEYGTTAALIKGLISIFLSNKYTFEGFNAYITSEVLGGSGLSSSAAFETIIGNIISGLFFNILPNAFIAMFGQKAESLYFGKPCGLMDQMATSVGGLIYIDFYNKDKPNYDQIDFDINKKGYSICITDTKGSHANLTADYAAIPAEMKSVAAYFGKEFLVEVPEDQVIDNISQLRQKLGDRPVLRALHFYEENKRVAKEIFALKDGNFNAFLQNVKASGDSSFKFLQNVYTNNDIQHQNVSLALCISEIVLGEDGGVARVHGGGFAGTIQAFVKNEKVDEYKAALNKVFGEGSCEVLKIRKRGGMQVF